MRRKWVEIKCKYCGKIVSVMPCKAKVRKFCSFECSSKYRIGEKNPQWKKVLMTCQYCGKVKYIHLSKVKTAKYCSRECQHKAGVSKETRTRISKARMGKPNNHKSECQCPICRARRGGMKGEDNPNYGNFKKKVLFKCLECGKILYLTPYLLKNGKKKYCSMECLHKANVGRKNTEETKRKMKENQPDRFGKNNSNYRGGILIPITCRTCGKIRHVIPSEAVTAKYCSKKCFHKFKKSKETRQKIREARINNPNRKYKNTSIEIKMQDILEKNGIDFEKHKPLLKKYSVDLFISPNIVIECDGDYWHNLPDNIIRDKRKNKDLIGAGYNLLRFWEHEINDDIEKCLMRIKKELT